MTGEVSQDLRILMNYRRLRNIKRCNNFFVNHPEDVAQHSYYTAIIAFTLTGEYNKLAREHNKNFHPLDDENTWEYISRETVLLKSLFHDVEEAFTSDIPWNVKHHDFKIHDEIQRCIREKLDKEFKESNLQLHKILMESSKVNIVGEMVQLSDSLEGAWYCYDELQTGNVTLLGLLKKYLELIGDNSIHKVLYPDSPLYKDMYDTFYQASLGNIIHYGFSLE